MVPIGEVPSVEVCKSPHLDSVIPIRYTQVTKNLQSNVQTVEISTDFSELGGGGGGGGGSSHTLDTHFYHENEESLHDWQKLHIFTMCFHAYRHSWPHLQTNQSGPRPIHLNLQRCQHWVLKLQEIYVREQSDRVSSRWGGLLVGSSCNTLVGVEGAKPEGFCTLWYHRRGYFKGQNDM